MSDLTATREHAPTLLVVGSPSVTRYGRAGSCCFDRVVATALAVGAVWLVLGRVSLLHAQTIPNEYRLKAAFVYQFPQFVDWPAAVWRGADNVRICILQPNPFGRELESLARGESLNGRPLSIKEFTPADGIGGCHVVFIGRGANGAAAVLKASAGQPVLTVGEGDRFLEEGGIIALRVVERRIRFDVSTSNAEKAGLRVSSQLLGLAHNVRGGPS